MNGIVVSRFNGFIYGLCEITIVGCLFVVRGWCGMSGCNCNGGSKGIGTHVFDVCCRDIKA